MPSEFLLITAQDDLVFTWCIYANSVVGERIGRMDYSQ
jgi:hypothetical protein